VGRSIGLRHPTGDLYALCFDAMVEGRLDLTLAGIPRGTRLHAYRPRLQTPYCTAEAARRQRTSD
jgi:hypothetical protein